MIKPHNYYMEAAQYAALHGTCFRRSVGCVLVDQEGDIISSGHNGAPLLLGDCLNDDSICPDRDVPAGQGMGKFCCFGIHAEIRALKDCKNISDIYMIYSTKAPCFQCVLILMTTPCQYIIFLTASVETTNKEFWEKVGGVWLNYNDIIEVEMSK